MHRILLTSPVVGTYSFCLLLGLIAGYWVARINARRLGIARRHIDNLTLLVAITGLAGARIFSWWFEFPPGYTLWEALREPSGGLVFYGGVVGGLFTAVAYCLFTKIKLRDLLDVMAAPLAVGLAFGRIGCFMAGCCWGDVCVDARQYTALEDPKLRYQMQTVPFLSGPQFPLAVRFPADCGALNQQIERGLLPPTATESLPVHPVQLYESGLAFLLAVILQRKFKRRAWAGEVFCWFCGGYGVARFLAEFLRADNPPDYFGFTLSQVISLIAMAACALMISVQRRTARVMPSQRPTLLTIPLTTLPRRH